MEATQVIVTIRNPAAPHRPLKHCPWSTRCDRLPGSTALFGMHRRTASGGQETALDTTTEDIEFMGAIVGRTILFCESLLGVTVMESVGIEVDPPKPAAKETANSALDASP